MQITALIQVINYLKEKSGDPVLLEGYKKLADIINEASKKKDADFSSEINKEKDLLQKYLWESDPVEWGYSSYCLFEKINNNCLFGKPAVDWLEKHVRPSSKDLNQIEADLTKKIKLISKLSDNLGKPVQLLDQVIPADVFHSDSNSENKYTMILYFEDDLKVKNITDLERYARLWDGILRSFSRLTLEEELPQDISSFQSGNLVLGVVIRENTLNAIMEGVTGILASLPLILKIRKIQNELTQIPLNNNLIDLLDEETEELIDQEAFRVAKDLTIKYQDENSGSEVLVKDMARSLKQIQSFICKGGKIEFKPLIPLEETSKTNVTLNEAFTITQELKTILGSLTRAMTEKEAQEVESE